MRVRSAFNNLEFGTIKKGKNMTDFSGKSIGRYHVVEPMGSGGMAVVYKAYDTRLERYVAIKFIRQEALQDPTSLKRFQREAHILAGLSHSNIVKVLDFGEYEGSPFLVMEYKPGETLKHHLGKPIAWKEAVRIILPVVRALEYIHQQGIIHRDVKPSNILLPAEGEAMLSDFGIAKMISNSDGAPLTAMGVGMGTPEYMSPEQAEGKEIDARSDIYSLGIVFFEMITGRAPFRADTPMAVVIKQISDPLPDPNDYLPSLPDMIRQILFKMLAKKPENRYETMCDLASALQAILTEAENGVIIEPEAPVVMAAPSSRPPLPAVNFAPSYQSIPVYQPPPPAKRQDNSWVWGVLAGALLLACLACFFFSCVLMATYSIW